MTMYKCQCGEIHDSAVQGPCPTWISIALAPVTPETVGAEIRRLLLSLRVAEHPVEREQDGWNNYGTDDLRRRALDLAGICWLAPGEMAPQCCCDWSPQDPEGPRLRMQERLR